MGNLPILGDHGTPAQKWNTKQYWQPFNDKKYVFIDSQTDLKKAESLMDWYQFEAERRHAKRHKENFDLEHAHIKALAEGMTHFLFPNAADEQVQKSVEDGVDFANAKLPRRPWPAFGESGEWINKWSGGFVVNLPNTKQDVVISTEEYFRHFY